MRFLLAPFLALCLITNASAQVSQEDTANIVVGQEQLFDAVCRVETPGEKGLDVGSGFVFAEDDATSYIMTCYHVVTDKPVKVRFQRDGFMSEPIPVEVVYKSYDPYKRDLAILALQKSKLKVAPRVLPLYSENVNYNSPKIWTLGHAGGSLHPSMFTGTIIERTEPGLHFSPPPKGGRSGSPIVGFKGSTDQRFAIGLIGWRNEETGLGKAMDISQIYAVLRGEDVSLAEPLTSYKGTPVQYYQNCPDGKCYPFQGFFNPNQSPPTKKDDQLVNPNNPWIKTPNAPLPVPGPPDSTLEKRVATLEGKVSGLDKKVDTVLITAQAVKGELAKQGIAIDTKLKNYATRDSFGNYVTKSELIAESKSIVTDVTTGVNNKVDNQINTVKGDIAEVSTKVDDGQSKLDKAIKVTETVGPLLAFVPGWGTAASLGLGGVGVVLDQLRRRKKKRLVEEAAKEETETNRTNDKNHVLALMDKKLQQTQADIEAANLAKEAALKESTEQLLKDKLAAQAKELEEKKEKENQLSVDAVLALIQQEISQRPTAEPLPQPAPEPYTAPVQHFHEQPARPFDINYTVAPENNDALYFRQAMEAVSKKYPETGFAIKLIEKAYPIFKSGVR